MRITINVSPSKTTGHSKDEILGKLRMGGWTVDGNGSRFSHYSARMGEVSVYGINFEKRRKKVKVLKNGNRKVITPTHWIAYVYNFSKYGKLVKIKQNKRNFELTVVK